jgi:PBP1b-binding outer membrane lipoprotein LpoB
MDMKRERLAAAMVLVVMLSGCVQGNDRETKRLPKNSYSANQPVMCRGWLVLG